MAITSIENPAKFLWETGLLGEINRVVLHPRGLMLSVAVEGEAVRLGELARTDDPEGIDFGPESLTDIRRKLAHFGWLDPLPEREKALGYVVQPLTVEVHGARPDAIRKP
jgi:hypothetical protein